LAVACNLHLPSGDAEEAVRSDLRACPSISSLERFAEGLRLQRTTASGYRFQVVLKNNLVHHDERLPVRDAAPSI
jgi:hypothetical protein